MAFLEPAAFANLRSNFAGQFEQEAGRLVFRANGNGAAISVSCAERDAFVAEYDRYLSRLRWRMWLWIMPPLLAGLILGVLLAPEGGPLMTAIIVATLAPALIWQICGLYRARGVPARALGRRLPVAAALPKEAARRKGLRGISWSAFAMAPAYVAFLVWRDELYDDPLAGRHVFWTVLAGGLLAVPAVQAVRKWRAERADQPHA